MASASARIGHYRRRTGHSSNNIKGCQHGKIATKLRHPGKVNTGGEAGPTVESHPVSCFWKSDPCQLGPIRTVRKQGWIITKVTCFGVCLSGRCLTAGDDTVEDAAFGRFVRSRSPGRHQEGPLGRTTHMQRRSRRHCFSSPWEPITYVRSVYTNPPARIISTS